MRMPKRMRTRAMERGGQLVELALILPFLLVLIAGVADFAQAWNVRQTLANAARDGARLGGNQLKADLTNTNPTTIQDLCQQVADYLIDQKIDTSFMGIPGTTSGNALTSSAVVANGCSKPGTVATSTGSTAPAEAYTYYNSGGYGLTIEPDIQVPPLGETCDTAGVTCVDSTRVTLTYPYSWSFGFNHVIELFGGSSSYASTITITVDATMPNIAQL